jgi:hypothetical protein
MIYCSTAYEKEVEMRKAILLLSPMVVALLIVWTHFSLAQNSTNQARPRLQCQERFNAMDTNHNGQVSEAEFMAVGHRRTNAMQMFQQMAQGKGYITQNEFCANKGGGGRGRNGGGGRGGTGK